MSYKQVKLKSTTDDLLDKCIDLFLQYYPEMKETKISRNKIIYEICMFYLK